MRYFIDTKSALKILYFFTAVDDKITEDELQKLREVASEFCMEDIETTVEQIIDECGEKLKSIESTDEQYDLISEEIDSILHSVPEDLTEGVVRRLLLWDLYAVSYSDEELHANEKRMISHVARKLEIEKSVVLEMEQLFATAQAVLKEETELKNSKKPYVEIRPMVEEVERRKEVILKSALMLIEDDFMEIVDKKQKANLFVAAGQKFSKSVAPKASEVGEVAQKSIKGAYGVAAKGVKGIAAGTGKMIEKLKKSEIVLPGKYKKIKGKFPAEAGLPKDAFGYEMSDEGANALLICFNVDEEAAMPFDDIDSIISGQHEIMQDNEGLVEVDAGKTKNGNEYVYIILKHRLVMEEGSYPQVEYTCNLNLKVGTEIKFINSSFMEGGTTGIRDNIVCALLRKENVLGADMEGWQRDPYDPDYKQGFLMNISEESKYDEMFPKHPLSEIRRLIEFIKGMN